MKRFAWLLAAAITLAAGCSKEKTPEPPQPPQPVEQTLLMYFPWSGNLTSEFLVNIQDMKDALLQEQPDACRVLVFFMKNGSEGRLFELIPDTKNEIVREEDLCSYEEPAITTAEGIATILTDVVREAPARRYAMTIGSHGMAWIPVNSPSAAAMLRSAEKEHWEFTDNEGRPLTRWFGGTSDAYRAEIGTLADAIKQAGLHMDFILFDDCYMSSVEVAYELRNAADYLIASPCEVMAYGFPYERIGKHLLGTIDYAAVCDEFYNFYSHYSIAPYGTIGVTACRELEALAAVMKRINAASDTEHFDAKAAGVQTLDGYTPTRFFDLGDYVKHLCTDADLLAEFEAQLERLIPAALRKHTDYYFSASTPYQPHEISAFSGINVSDPSTSAYTAAKTETAWWKATH